jgi:predicted phosphoribosyltransferase
MRRHVPTSLRNVDGTFGAFARMETPMHGHRPASDGTDRSERRLFPDRGEAGARLGHELRRYGKDDVLVVGVARGGVLVAREVARHLEAELDVLVARKLESPDDEELAVGAVTADGASYLNHEIIHVLGVPDSYLGVVTASETAEALRAEALYRAGHPAIEPGGRTVILVDDGIATGATMRAAIQSLRRRVPWKLVVAVPVGQRETCEVLRKEVDALVCLKQPEPFYAIGLHYGRFEQPSDEDVIRALREQRDEQRALREEVEG